MKLIDNNEIIVVGGHSGGEIGTIERLNWDENIINLLGDSTFDADITKIMIF